MFENFDTRDCNKCIHHISGNCTKWDCEYETLEQHDQKVKATVLDDLFSRCNYVSFIDDDTDLFKVKLKDLIGIIAYLKEPYTLTDLDGPKPSEEEASNE